MKGFITNRKQFYVKAIQKMFVMMWSTILLKILKLYKSGVFSRIYDEVESMLPINLELSLSNKKRLVTVARQLYKHTNNLHKT